MYFGDYLVSEKIITTNQLLEALCFQLESMPSFFKILFEKQLVSSERLLGLIKEQIKNDFDLITVLESKNLLTKDQINLIMQIQVNQKMPLGEVLVKLQFISSTQLHDHLENYYKVKDTYGSKDHSAEIELNKENTNENSNISDAALDSLRELGIDVSELTSEINSNNHAIPKITVSSDSIIKPEIKHFLDIFNEKQKNKILKLIDFCVVDANKGASVGNYFNSLFRDIHLVKGAIFFSEINVLEKPLSQLDNLLEKILSGDEDYLSTFIKKNHEILQKCILSLWSIRIFIEEKSSDQGIEKLDAYFELCSLVNEIYN